MAPKSCDIQKYQVQLVAGGTIYNVVADILINFFDMHFSNPGGIYCKHKTGIITGVTDVKHVPGLETIGTHWASWKPLARNHDYVKPGLVKPMLYVNSFLFIAHSYKHKVLLHYFAYTPKH